MHRICKTSLVTKPLLLAAENDWINCSLIILAVVRILSICRSQKMLVLFFSYLQNGNSFSYICLYSLLAANYSHRPYLLFTTISDTFILFPITALGSAIGKETKHILLYEYITHNMTANYSNLPKEYSHKARITMN